MHNPCRVVYLNGAMWPADEARISPQDRGFLYGDGAFETVLLQHGKPAQWAFHAERLRKSLEVLQINISLPHVLQAVKALIETNQLQQGLARITITRGVGGRGYKPDVNATPTLYIILYPHDIHAAPAPVALHISPWRKIPQACFPTQGKLAHSLNYVLSSMEEGEGLLLTLEGHVAETASGNIFWRKGEQLYTPSLETGCIHGSIRHLILQHCAVQEGLFPLETLMHADEVFFTNVGKIVCSVQAMYGSQVHFSDHSYARTLRAELIEVLCG